MLRISSFDIVNITRIVIIVCKFESVPVYVVDVMFMHDEFIMTAITLHEMMRLPLVEFSVSVVSATFREK